MLNTPILFLIFNRPDTTEKVFAKIREVEPKRLYIAADGPRENRGDDIIKCIEARSIVNKIDWDCEVKTLFNVENKGCGKAVSDAIKWFFMNVEEGIILEDDCLAGVSFFNYCTVLLERYRHEKKIMHISGNNFQSGIKRGEGDYFYSIFSHNWGWATWRRAWKYYEFELEKAPPISLKKYSVAFNKNLGFIKWWQDIFSKVKFSQVNTWDYQWQYAMILRGGMSICPNVNLVENIGFGEDATHTKQEVKWITNNKAQSLETFRSPSMMKLNYEADYFAMYKVFGIKDETKQRKTIPQMLSAVKRRVLGKIPSASLMQKLPDPKSLEIDRIQKISRFIDGSTDIMGKSVSFVDSASFLFNYKDIITKEIYKFEANIDNPYIIDCGANIGLSIIYFKQLYPHAEIVGFEPDDKVFKALQHNIEAFNFSDVELIKKACWNEETTLKFYSEGADGGRVAMNFDTEQIIDVETVRLREFLDRKVDFLKIDIEGSEVLVLADCEDLLINVKNLFVEYHSYIEVEQNLDQLLKILKKSGFRYSIQQHGIVSKNPFINIENQDKMDILLNIFAYRVN
jgi:FkbM family methyltransferase